MKKSKTLKNVEKESLNKEEHILEEEDKKEKKQKKKKDEAKLVVNATNKLKSKRHAIIHF